MFFHFSRYNSIRFIYTRYTYRVFALLVIVSLLFASALPLFVFGQEAEGTSLPEEVPERTTEESILANSEPEEEPESEAGLSTTPSDSGNSGAETTTTEGEPIILKEGESSELGDDGLSGEAVDGSEGGPTGDTAIETGDATASGDIENSVNSNNLTTDGSGSSDETADETNASSEEEEVSLSEGGGGETESFVEGDANGTTTLDALRDEEAGTTEGDIAASGTQGGKEDERVGVENVEEGGENGEITTTSEVSNENNAEVDNEATIEAGTGSNTANNNNNVSINTGNAVASANILNVVNTNIFNSAGFFLFLSNLLGFIGDVDLREYNLFTPTSGETATENARTSVQEDEGECPLGCDEILIDTINNNSETTIINDVVVRAVTGDNELVGNSGTGSVNTGDAYAAANLINIVNTNIIDSNYLLLTFNNFGDWDGDVVFPSADIFTSLFGGNGGRLSGTISNTNTALIDNTVSTEAETGGNTAESDGGISAIETGDASSQTNIINQVNMNLLGVGSFTILFRVHGEWMGDVFGAPDGMSWQETQDGVQLVFDPEGSLSSLASSAVPNITNNSTSTILNNVQVLALTGDNKIESDGDADAFVTTGDAYASVNIINVANTNVIGQNWLFAIFNIFGDWTGNISFGRPDLWIGGLAEVESNPGPNSNVIYRYTVRNFGDATATDVRIRHYFDSEKISFSSDDPSTGVYINSNELEWSIGDIPAGDTKEVTYKARISSDIPMGESLITSSADVTSFEPDDNPIDNTELLSFSVFRSNPALSSGTRVTYTPSPNLKITKTNFAVEAITASSTLDYTIVIINDGAGSAYDALLEDILMDEDGNIIYRETWELDEIYPGEEIEVTYTTFFNDATEPGIYTNYAKVYALGGHPTFFYGYNGDSDKVESSIEVIAPLEEDIEQEPLVEIISESVEINGGNDVTEEAGEEEPIILITRALVPLYTHPVFTQHPVYVNFPYFASLFSHPLFNGTMWGNSVNHPLFTQHPVYIKRAVLAGIIQHNNSPYTSWMESLAGSFFMSALKWPFDQVTTVSAFEDAVPSPVDREKVLVLLAMSIFIMDRRRKKKVSM